MILLPLLVLGFFCLRESSLHVHAAHGGPTDTGTELDRGNIANAITDTFMQDVGINQFQFNVGQQLLSLGIVLFEIPSNMLLYRVGPGKWLTLQLFLFGLVSTFQAWQTNYSSYLATRFLLGLTEAGYIPGGLWTLSTWYTRSETAKRVMIFFFGNQLGQASAKLIAYGILHMRGVAGRPGWFWLFVLMGAFTIASGIILGFFLPDSFDRPHSWFLPRWQIFTGRELYILRNRVYNDDPSKAERKSHIGRRAFAKCVCPHIPSTCKAKLTGSSPTGRSGCTFSSLSPTTVLSGVSTRMDPRLSATLAMRHCRATPWLLLVSSSRSRYPSPLAGYLITSKCYSLS